MPSIRVIIGCDVDPVLPEVIHPGLGDSIWSNLHGVGKYLDDLKYLPPIAWLIRSDESVRVATGSYDSGFSFAKEAWRTLEDAGHELGWHMHLITRSGDTFVFDDDPGWLAESHAALQQHFCISTIRTGWDYGSTVAFNRFAELGVELDFSSLPGNRVWWNIFGRSITIDWLHSPITPYRMASEGYTRSGRGKIWEVPVTQFKNPLMRTLRRYGRRLTHGCVSWHGLRNKTLEITHRWETLPIPTGDTMAFYFHTDGLIAEGMENFHRNIDLLKRHFECEFVRPKNLIPYLEKTHG